MALRRAVQKGRASTRTNAYPVSWPRWHRRRCGQSLEGHLEGYLIPLCACLCKAADGYVGIPYGDHAGSAMKLHGSHGSARVREIIFLENNSKPKIA